MLQDTSALRHRIPVISRFAFAGDHEDQTPTFRKRSPDELSQFRFRFGHRVSMQIDPRFWRKLALAHLLERLPIHLNGRCRAVERLRFWGSWLSADREIRWKLDWVRCGSLWDQIRHRDVFHGLGQGGRSVQRRRGFCDFVPKAPLVLRQAARGSRARHFVLTVVC